MATASEAERAGTEAEKRNGRMRRVIAIIAAAALIGGGGWLVYHLLVGRYFEETNDAYVRGDSVTVSSKVSGYVEQLFVADNQDVRAGTPLVRLDARDYRAQSAQYVAQQGVSSANADNIRAQIREQEATIDQSRAQLTSALATQRFADGELARYTPLAASGAETREKLASLRRQSEEAHADVAQRRAGLETAQRRIGSLTAQIRQAEAQGKAAQAQLAAANVNLNSALIRASITGKIGDRSVRIGQYVQPGMRLMSIVPVDALYVVANFKETQIGHMRPGQSVTVSIDALPDADVRGHVESLSPGTGAEFSLLPPQNATGNFTKIVQRVPVRIAIDAAPEVRRRLIAGLSVRVTVDTRAGAR
ncbi:HlyD family secretion protein [Sphingomonas sp. AP4-R1]|uniref:HlyD family secretion protein n=1 Tax=Sphingomonas sp. AP4-R1 TaxID=2735134 RepID=UPI0014935887|nr:HlyD family secretion protein [Sphingomonas sp. AP4-R1]QJU58745.1 HlyD family secretion protein [Sphingomonas sp. AP4-R1]